jgi:tripartite-type tricarboxylate transporter receptor subunit TctC
MNREINRALGTPPVVEAIRALGAEPQPITPREFGDVIRADMARYAKIIQERKITQD